jgi:hypothetical protein
MGIEPMTPVLPRLCATSAPHGQGFRVGSERFELPKLTQLIYSQPQLATLVTAQVELKALKKTCFRHKEYTTVPPE